ncbi:MAG: hypothetical protein HFH45_03200 [Bacilli bacterium]|nr:hypothetical protein [Bacilli bacterium]
MTLEQRKKEFAKKVGKLTFSSVSIKFNDDENWPIDYIRIDGNKYSNPEKIGEKIIRVSKNIRQAVELGRTLETVNDHGQHIDPFIIKYHPSWITIRQQFGFTQREEDEILCVSEDYSETYENQIKDSFTALGIHAEYDSKVKRTALLSTKVFDELFPEEVVHQYVNDKEKNHPDFVAFIETYIIKERIEQYHRQRNSGISEKEIEYSFRGVNWTLDADGFPIITIGSGNNKKRYDFRNKKSFAMFWKKIAEKNPKSEFGKSLKKKMKKARY